MNERISELRAAGEAAIAEAPGTTELEDVRVRFLGRRAELPNLLRGVAQLPPELVRLLPQILLTVEEFPDLVRDVGILGGEILCEIDIPRPASHRPRPRPGSGTSRR